MEEISFFPLLIISALAFVVPIIASRLPGGLVPIVVAEIIAGIIFGEAGFGLIESNVWLEFLSLFGFGYLMFLSGLEVDFGLLSIRREGSGLSLLGNPLVMGLSLFVLTLIGAGLGAWWLLGSAPITHIMLMGLVLSTTSVGIVVPILKERGLIREPFGQTVLLAAMVADFVTIFLITVLAAILDSADVLSVALIAILFGAFFSATQLGARLKLHGIVERTLEELAHATAQVRVRGALALMLVFVVLAETVGAELVLGAFLAGAVISSLSREEGTALKTKLDAIGYGFFVPIFFITVGASFDITALRESPSSLTLVPLLIAIAFAVKIIPALLLKGRYSLRQSLSAGVLLSSRLSLIIAASVIGLRLGVIDEATNSAMILVAIVTSTVAPAIFSRLFPKVEIHPGRAVIIGGGEVGRLLARRLERQHITAVLIEVDSKRAESLREQGFRVITGTGTSTEVLEAAETDGVTAFIAVTPDDDLNFRACQIARDSFNVEHLMARVNYHARLEDFTNAGIKAISRGMAMAITLDNLVLRPDLFDILSDQPGDSEFLEVPLWNGEFVGRAVHTIHLPGDAIIVLIHREESSFVPHPETILERNDLITIAGDRDSVDEAARLLTSEDDPVAIY